MKTPTELTDRFRSEGLKVTPQRQAVFQVLYDNHVHPTAEAVHAEVCKDLPMVSLRTVYQTLNDLTAMGELGHLHVGTGSSRFDPNTEPHHHLVCEQCGRVVDLPVESAPIVLPPAGTDGFTVTRTEVVFRGRCAACAEDPQSTNINNKEA